MFEVLWGSLPPPALRGLGGWVREGSPVATAGTASAPRLLERLRGAIPASLLCGAGLRLLECCRLRVKDVDLERGEIVVRDGKGPRDRAAMLPEAFGPLGCAADWRSL